MKIIKYTNKNIGSFYIVVSLCIVFFSFLAFAAYGKIEDKASNQKSSKNYTVVLDAGHGGEDGGAVGFNNICEKDINLSIALGLRDLLEASGYNVIMTRQEDTAIYDESCKSLREKKRSDLKNRLEIIKENSQDSNIFISVHQNKFTDPKYSGSQIFYSKNNPLSQELATYIKQSIVELIQPDNTREIKPGDKNIYLLHNAEIPSAIVECGFLSNEEEAKKLNTKQYQGQLAFCIYCGIANYFANL